MANKLGKVFGAIAQGLQTGIQTKSDIDRMQIARQNAETQLGFLQAQKQALAQRQEQQALELEQANRASFYNQIGSLAEMDQTQRKAAIEFGLDELSRKAQAGGLTSFTDKSRLASYIDAVGNDFKVIKDNMMLAPRIQRDEVSSQQADAWAQTLGSAFDRAIRFTSMYDPNSARVLMADKQDMQQLVAGFNSRKLGQKASGFVTPEGQPISKDTLGNLRDAGGTAVGGFTESGQPIVTAKPAKAGSGNAEAKAAGSALDTVEQAYLKAHGALTGAERSALSVKALQNIALSGPGAAVYGAMRPAQAEAAGAYQSLKSLIGPALTRAAGDRGNIPDQMINRFEEFVLPSFSVSEDVAKAKFSAIRNFLSKTANPDEMTPQEIQQVFIESLKMAGGPDVSKDLKQLAKPVEGAKVDVKSTNSKSVDDLIKGLPLK